jgi:eukaryotic-like serine/threonine-protein kinase
MAGERDDEAALDETLDGRATSSSGRGVALDSTMASDGSEPGPRPPGGGSRPRGGATGSGGGITAAPGDREARRRLIESPDQDHPELAEVDPDTYVHGYEVARGGMGRIVAARDRRLGRVVAIKELVQWSPDRAARFEREALITARLQHPAIVNIHEAGRWPTGEPFFAMKLVAGRSLAEVAADRRPLAGRLELLPNLIATAEAVAYAHRQRIIHRDLKPSNVLIGDLGETVVIDWGLAKDLAAPEGETGEAETVEQHGDTPLPGNQASRSGRATGPNAGSSDLTVAGSVMGTPGYMPPEQAAGADVGERADVYSLGAILYHLLAGTEPYPGASGAEVLARVLEGPPPRPAEIEPGLPHDLCTIIEKAMSRDPADRYPSALELALDLRRFQTGQLVAAHRYSRRELAIRFVVRHRHVLGASTIALVATAIILSVSFQRVVSERDRAETATASALRRADELALAQASSLVDSDPRQSLEMLAGLSADAPPPVWRRARLIASEARLRGIPAELKGHGARVRSLALSDSGQVLASADEMAVHIWDLRTGRGRQLARQPSAIGPLRLSPDGARVATAALDGIIRVWSTDDGWGTQLSGHEAYVFQLEFLDGDQLVSSSADGTVRKWRVSTGEHEVLGRHEGTIASLAVSRDQRVVASAGEDRVVRVWRLDQPGGATAELRGPGKFISTVALDHAGRQVAAVDGEELWLWNVASGEGRALTGHEGGVNDVAFSPDGLRLASAGRDHTVRLWDVETGTSEVLRGHEDSVQGIQFDRDGSKLVSTSRDGSVRLWSVGEKLTSAVQVLGDHDSWFAAAMSEDGSTIVTASGLSVRHWNISAAGTALRGHRGAVRHLVFSPTGKLLVSAADDWTLRLWSLGGAPGSRPPPRVLRSHEGRIQSLAMSPAGDQVATLDSVHRVRLWPLAPGGAPRTLDGYGFGAPVFSPTGALIAAPSLDHTVRLWDTATGEARVLGGHTSWVVAVAFSPDGRALASAGADRLVRIWSFPGGERRDVDGHGAPVRHLVFAGAGHLVSADVSGAVREVATAGGESRELSPGQGAGVSALAASPRGDLVAWVDGEDNVQLWSRRAEKTRSLARSGRTIFHLAFSADGRTLLGRGGGDHALVWDTATGAGMALRSYGRDVHDLAISPDGLLIATAESDHTVRLWPYDLPQAPEALRAWLERAAAAR